VGRHGELNREPEVRLEFTAPVQRETQVVAALVAAHPYEEPAFDVYRRRAEAGMLGRIGRVEPGTVLGDMVRRVRDALGEPPLRVAGALERPVESVAVLPGSGSDFLHQAAAAGADLAITGDIAHHRAREALDRGLMLLDPGHAATERPGLERLFTALAAEGLAVRSLLELDPDPWAVPDGISS
jgi:putative NIF3 family GTP cyclohydrolase 1 type 2